MHTTYRIILAATCVSLAAAPAFARQLARAAGQRPIGQAASANRIAELARQNTAGIICRGGPGLSIETRGPSPNGSAVQDMVTLSLSFRRVERPAGVDGRALDPGTCSIVDRVLGPMEPGRIQFDTSANAQAKQALHGGVVDTSANAAERYADAKTIPAYLNDPNHYWRFDAVRTTGGYFSASVHGPVKPATLTERQFIGSNPATPATGPGSTRPRPGALNPLSTSQNPTNLADMDDRAIIIIGGRQSTIGQLKQEVRAIGPGRGPREGVLKDLLNADDRAIIVIGGRQTAAGPISQALNAEIARKSVQLQQPLDGSPINPGEKAGLNPQPLPPKAGGDTAVLGTARGAGGIPSRAERRDPSEREPDVRVTPTSQDVQIRFTAARFQSVHVTLYNQSPAMSGGVAVSPPLLVMNTNIGKVFDGFGSSLIERVEYVASARSQLKPDTRYYFAITVSSSYGSSSEVGTFVTLQADAAPPSSGSAAIGGASMSGRFGSSGSAPAAGALPKNLSQLDDRAIIVIGGRQRTAGDFKREVSQQLRTVSGPPQRFSVPTRKIAGLTPLPAAAQAALERAPSRAEIGALEIKGSAGEMRSNGRGSGFEIDCVRNEPRLNTIAAPIVAGRQFTLRGNCFGDKGKLELIGQFSPSNGPLVVPVYSWTNTEIIAGMPSVQQVADHLIAVTVMRIDGKRSDAKQARFLAERDLVPVPARFWQPTQHFSLVDVKELVESMFGNQTLEGTHPGTFVNTFSVSVNAACSLDTMETSSTIGRVHEVNGWDNGPPHVANVQIVWSPTCQVETTDLLVAKGQVRRCAVDFELKAMASCPRGIQP